MDPLRNTDLANPQGWNSYAYVRNNPMNATDPTGMLAETPWDAFNVAMDLTSLVTNIAAGNVGGALLDAGGLILDVGATVVPGVPGGAGVAIKAARAADKAADAARAADKAKDAASVYRSVDEATGTVRYVGITNSLERRAAEHLRQGRVIGELPGLGTVSRSDARAVEQVLIELHGLAKRGGTLENKINSIARTNPRYAEQLKRGMEVLAGAGY